MIQINGDSLLLLNNEKGLSAIYFTPTVDATNQKLLCTINGIYVIDVTTPSHNLYGSTGHITNPAYITECIGEQTTFTLYVNSEGVVTSDDLPALLPENTVK